jgi:hypothetical protein
VQNQVVVSDASMKLPNAEQAVVEIAKLTEYCLNPTHPRGRHKARVFQAMLGITAKEANSLRDSLLEAAISDVAIEAEGDDYGQRYVVEFHMVGPVGEATIRSAWIILAHEDFPRFVSCYVL